MSYWGMNPHTGRAVEDDAHISQSIDIILTTHIGKRIQRRPVGAEITELMDRPLNGRTRLQLMAATAMALARWEPRVELSTIVANVGTGDAAGALTLDIAGRRRDSKTAFTTSVLLRG